jgi:hypothetical protein
VSILEKLERASEVDGFLHNPDGPEAAAVMRDLVEALEGFNVKERNIVIGTADTLTIRVPIAAIQKAAAALSKVKPLTSGGVRK